MPNDFESLVESQCASQCASIDALLAEFAGEILRRAGDRERAELLVKVLEEYRVVITGVQRCSGGIRWSFEQLEAELAAVKADRERLRAEINELTEAGAQW